MIVLGLHGWEGSHDPAAALLIDGRLVACIEEERLTRMKHGISQLPILSAFAVLHEAGLQFEDIDAIAYGWDVPAYLGRKKGSSGIVSDFHIVEAIAGRKLSSCPKVEWINHHKAHAASAFFSSGFPAAAVIVVDGQGESASISVFAAEIGKGLSLVKEWPPSRSLGFLYEAATLQCGFGFLDSGKTMGLAAYGERPSVPLPIHWRDDDILSPIDDALEEEGVVREWRRILVDRFGQTVPEGKVFNPATSSLVWRDDFHLRHASAIAAAAQESIEGVMVGLIGYAQRVTGFPRVALAGGVALNCVANGLLSDHCSELFISPMSHDAGAAAGAAIEVASGHGETIRIPEGADLGISYGSEEITRSASASKLPFSRPADIYSDAAARLADGQIIGWFQGRSEVGPRALGQRSILALPTDGANVARVNDIKSRERWRPFAPSALEDETGWIFGRAVVSPYMLKSYRMTDRARALLPAVTHVDGSTRVQTVSETGSPFSSLLQAVKKETGRGIVLNTSFNGAREPIVCSPSDAIRTFGAIGLDALYIGDLLIEKRR